MTSRNSIFRIQKKQEINDGDDDDSDDHHFLFARKYLAPTPGNNHNDSRPPSIMSDPSFLLEQVEAIDNLLSNVTWSTQTDQDDEESSTRRRRRRRRRRPVDYDEDEEDFEVEQVRIEATQVLLQQELEQVDTMSEMCRSGVATQQSLSTTKSLPVAPQPLQPKGGEAIASPSRSSTLPTFLESSSVVDNQVSEESTMHESWMCCSNESLATGIPNIISTTNNNRGDEQAGWSSSTSWNPVPIPMAHDNTKEKDDEDKDSVVQAIVKVREDTDMSWMPPMWPFSSKTAKSASEDGNNDKLEIQSQETTMQNSDVVKSLDANTVEAEQDITSEEEMCDTSRSDGDQEIQSCLDLEHQNSDFVVMTNMRLVQNDQDETKTKKTPFWSRPLARQLVIGLILLVVAAVLTSIMVVLIQRKGAANQQPQNDDPVQVRPSNDECTGAVGPLQPGLPIYGSLEGATNHTLLSSTAAACAPTSVVASKDVWYVTSGNGLILQASIPCSSDDDEERFLSVYAGSNCTFLACLEASHLRSETACSISWLSQASTNYYIQVVQSLTTATDTDNTFVLNLDTFATNDECSDAEILILSPSTRFAATQGSLQWATVDSSMSLEDGIISKLGVWYKVYGTGMDILPSISSEDDSSTSTIFTVDVYQGPCDALQYITQFSSSSAFAQEQSKNSSRFLAPLGVTFTLFVWTEAPLGGNGDQHLALPDFQLLLLAADP